MVIVADEKLRKQLGAMTVPVEIKDEAGNTLGHVLSPTLIRQMAQVVDGEPTFSETAWKAMLDQKGGKPLTEIWKQLGQA